MDRDEFRQGCMNKAVSGHVSISRLGDDRFRAYSKSGTTYIISKVNGGLFECRNEEDNNLCPSYEHRGYCKHLAAVDIHLVSRGKRATREVRVKARGETRTFMA